DLEHAAELVELVDVSRSEIASERGEHLIEGNLQRLGLHPVDLEPVLRNARAERRQHHLQRRLRLGIRRRLSRPPQRVARPRGTKVRSRVGKWKPVLTPRNTTGARRRRLSPSPVLLSFRNWC